MTFVVVLLQKELQLGGALMSVRLQTTFLATCGTLGRNQSCEIEMVTKSLSLQSPAFIAPFMPSPNSMYYRTCIRDVRVLGSMASERCLLTVCGTEVILQTRSVNQ